jgi:hypothetical protein
VKVAVRCQPSCLLRLDLYGQGKRSKTVKRRLSNRAAGVGGRRRVFTLRIRRPGALRPHGLLRATALGRSGGVTKRHQRVRIR